MLIGKDSVPSQSLARVVRHPKKAEWESVAHVRSKVPRARVFPFTALSSVAFSTLAGLFAKSAVELTGSTVQTIVRDWASGAQKGRQG